MQKLNIILLISLSFCADSIMGAAKSDDVKKNEGKKTEIATFCETLLRVVKKKFHQKGFKK